MSVAKLAPVSPHAFTHAFNAGLYVAESPIHGRGLFAKRAFKRGEIILIMRGLIMHDTVYPEFVAEFPELDCTVCRGSGDYLLFDPAFIETEYDNFINHSDHPNALFHCSSIFALRDIAMHDEITTDYHYLLTQYEEMVLPNGEIIKGMDGRSALLASTAQLLQALSV